MDSCTFHLAKLTNCSKKKANFFLISMHDADEHDPRIQCPVIHDVKYIFGSHFPLVLIVCMHDAHNCSEMCKYLSF